MYRKEIYLHNFVLYFQFEILSWALIFFFLFFLQTEAETKVINTSLRLRTV